MLRISRNLYTVSNFRRIKFPQKFKGTIIERWADYWKNLFIDYRQMFQDLRSDIQDEPYKAFKWTVGLMAMYALARNNPSEMDFKHNLKQIANEVVLVSDECQNPDAVEHLRYLDTCYNQGVLHYQNLAVGSIIYTSAVNDACDLYRAQCSYLKPTVLSFPSRIVDVGIMGRWWNIYIRTRNYDVNF